MFIATRKDAFGEFRTTGTNYRWPMNDVKTSKAVIRRCLNAGFVKQGETLLVENVLTRMQIMIEV